jgi:ketosteroid isomerase-like protein
MSAVYTRREADEAQIKQQVARIAEGIRAKDLEGLRPIYATHVVSFDIEPPLQHVGVETKLQNWANVFAVFPDADYEVRGLSVAVGDDVAFGHCFGRLPWRADEWDGDQGHLGPGHVLLPEARRGLADRARPGIGAVRRAQRPRSGRPRTLTVLSSLPGLTRASSPGPVRAPMVQIS